MVKVKKKPVAFPVKFPRELVVDVANKGVFYAATEDDLSVLELEGVTEVGIYKLVGLGVVHPRVYLERK